MPRYGATRHLWASANARALRALARDKTSKGCAIRHWIPAFAGMTSKSVAATRNKSHVAVRPKRMTEDEEFAPNR